MSEKPQFGEPGPTVEDYATAMMRFLGAGQSREFFVALAREIMLAAVAAQVTREAGFNVSADDITKGHELVAAVRSRLPLGERIRRGADWDKLPKVRARKARKKR